MDQCTATASNKSQWTYSFKYSTYITSDATCQQYATDVNQYSSYAYGTAPCDSNAITNDAYVTCIDSTTNVLELPTANSISTFQG